MVSDTSRSWVFARDAPFDTARFERASSPLKYCVLEYIDGNPGATYVDLAEHLDMPREYAADRLNKYTRRGLLDRDRRSHKERSAYSLSGHGRGRLRWFRGLG